MVAIALRGRVAEARVTRKSRGEAFGQVNPLIRIDDAGARAPCGTRGPRGTQNDRIADWPRPVRRVKGCSLSSFGAH